MFLKWGKQAFSRFSVVPPGTGICHQVNLEYLGKAAVSYTHLAIAWHLREVIGGDDARYSRVVFNEMTKNAIRQAFNKPGELNIDCLLYTSLRREKSRAGIVPVFLNQRDGFRKQLDTSEVVGFLSLVFQPEAEMCIRDSSYSYLLISLPRRIGRISSAVRTRSSSV